MTDQKKRAGWSRTWPQFWARLDAAMGSPAWWAWEVVGVIVTIALGLRLGVLTDDQAWWVCPLYMVSSLLWAGVQGGMLAPDPVSREDWEATK